MPRDAVHLVDILEAARLAQSYVADVTRDDFLADTKLQDAVIRRIEVMGEAARRISSNTRDAHPSIPWKEMIGMRNLMIHAYDHVDMTVVWDTVQDELPRVIAKLEPLTQT